jgi:broad specificity phosphatase PhoE
MQAKARRCGIAALPSSRYTQGFESPKLVAVRLQALVAELHAMKRLLPKEAVVAFVSHGGTIAELINYLLLKVAEGGGTTLDCHRLSRI